MPAAVRGFSVVVRAARAGGRSEADQTQLLWVGFEILYSGPELTTTGLCLSHLHISKKILYCGSLHCISLLLSIFCDLNTRGLFHEPLLLFLVVYNTTFSSFMRFCCAAYLRFYFLFHSGPGSTAPGVARGGKTTRNFGVCQLADDARSQGNYNCWA